jgi:hypothetical protein
MKMKSAVHNWLLKTMTMGISQKLSPRQGNLSTKGKIHHRIFRAGNCHSQLWANNLIPVIPAMIVSLKILKKGCRQNFSMDYPQKSAAKFLQGIKSQNTLIPMIHRTTTTTTSFLYRFFYVESWAIGAQRKQVWPLLPNASFRF